MSPPEPADVAQRIISDVLGEVSLDLAPVRSRLEGAAARARRQYIWPRAERLALEELEPAWPGEVEEQCRRGLDEAHRRALVQAQRCLDASRDLETHGRRSWIAGAVMHHFTFEAVWDALSEDGEPLDDGQGEDDEAGEDDERSDGRAPG